MGGIEMTEQKKTWVTHNDRKISTWQTCGKGQIRADYDAIVRAFGPPLVYTGSPDSDGKVDWSWFVEFDCGTVATIYNWKDGPGYGHNVGPDRINTWQIGGAWKGPRIMSVDLVSRALGVQAIL